MICNLRPDQAERVLCGQTYSTPDDKVMNRTWIRNFIVVGLFLVASAVLVTLHPDDNKCWFILSGALAVVVIVTSKFIKARVIGPKKFKASIERYGRENLMAQLTSGTSQGFFFDPAGENTENIAVVTRDYLVVARENIYEIAGLKSIFFVKRGYSESSLARFNDEYTREVLRNIYMMDITLANGRHRKEFVAVPPQHIHEFIAALNMRAGDDENRFRLF